MKKVITGFPDVMVTDNTNGVINHSTTTSESSVIIRQFEQDDLESVKELFTSYHKWLNLDLKFQDYENEFANLPGKYAIDQGGSLLLAFHASSSKQQDHEPIGCLALRTLSMTNDIQSSIRNVLGIVDTKEISIDTRCCELKRLFVKPSARGMKVGNFLIMATLKEAKKQGYEYAFLDTLPDCMQGACTLYKRFGFEQTIPYYQTPLADRTLFFIKQLY